MGDHAAGWVHVCSPQLSSSWNQGASRGKRLSSWWQAPQHNHVSSFCSCHNLLASYWPKQVTWPTKSRGVETNTLPAMSLWQDCGCRCHHDGGAGGRFGTTSSICCIRWDLVHPTPPKGQDLRSTALVYFLPHIYSFYQNRFICILHFKNLCFFSLSFTPYRYFSLH